MPPAPAPSTGSPFFWLTSAGHFLSPGHFLPVPRGSGPVLAFLPPGTSAAGLTPSHAAGGVQPGTAAQPPPRCRGAAGSATAPRTRPQARAPCRLRTAVATVVTPRISLCSGTSVRLCRASWLKATVSSAFPVF